MNKKLIFLSSIMALFLVTNALANEEHYSHMQKILVAELASPSMKLTVKK